MKKYNLKSVIKNIDKNTKRNNFPFLVKIKKGSWLNVLEKRYNRIGLNFYFTRNGDVLNKILNNDSYDYDLSDDFLFEIIFEGLK